MPLCDWVENTSPVDADGDYASNCPFDARWSFPLRTRSPIEIGSSLGFIYLAYLFSTQDLRRNLLWSINSSIYCPTTLRSDRPHRCNRPLGNLQTNGSSPGPSLATWLTKLTRSSLDAVTSRLGWSNKRRRLRTSPCGSATANPSPSTPHPARADRAALTAHSASAPTSRGSSIDSTFGASTATIAKIEPSATPSTRSTLRRGTLTPIPRSPTISMTPGRTRRGPRRLDSGRWGHNNGQRLALGDPC